MFRTFAHGLQDIVEGIKKKAVWSALATEDITDQHRRTTLGPVWLLLNYLAFALTFIAIFSNRELGVNFPGYVAIGLFVWLYILEVVTMSVSLFIREENFIKGTTLPLSVYVMRLFMQSVIRACFAFAGCMMILFYAEVGLSPYWLYSLAGMLLIAITTPAAIILLSIAGAFFPDIQFVVTNIMRLGMFLTPIFWVDNAQSGLRAILAFWNPFAYFLDIVRAPILEQTVPVHSFGFCLLFCLLIWFLAVYVLGANRKRVAFVL